MVFEEKIENLENEIGILKSNQKNIENNDNSLISINKDGFTYYNNIYDFKLDLPKDWKGFWVDEEEDMIKFGYKEHDQVFAISIFDNDEWNDVYNSTPDGYKPKIENIRKNNKYTFSFGNQAQYYGGEDLENRRKELTDIFLTFEFLD